jgi:uncharacterized protein (DUF433 family)
MASINTAVEIDWTQCELIERVPGKVSGRPIVRGTRILPDAIVSSYDVGEPLELIHENYPGLSITQIQRLIEYAKQPSMTASKPSSQATRPSLTSRTLPGGALQSWCYRPLTWHILKDNLPPILAALERATPGSFQDIQCGGFSRKKQPEK